MNLKKIRMYLIIMVSLQIVLGTVCYFGAHINSFGRYETVIGNIGKINKANSFSFLVSNLEFQEQNLLLVINHSPEHFMSSQGEHAPIYNSRTYAFEFDGYIETSVICNGEVVHSKQIKPNGRREDKSIVVFLSRIKKHLGCDLEVNVSSVELSRDIARISFKRTSRDEIFGYDLRELGALYGIFNLLLYISIFYWFFAKGAIAVISGLVTVLLAVIYVVKQRN